METKALIRRQILELRDGMDAEERERKSSLIAGRVMDHPAFKEADCILCYASYKSEADTFSLMGHALAMGKKVYCPKVHGKEMEFYRIFSMEDLKKGYKGIREPRGEGERLFMPGMAAEEKCLMVMPGSVFDRDRNRIGYGGGYYDRYLAGHAGIATVAVCFDMQVLEKVPSDVYDRKPDMVLTERGIYI